MSWTMFISPVRHLLSGITGEILSTAATQELKE